MHILGVEFEKEKIVLFLRKYGPLLLVTVLAAALRFYRLGRYGLWYDEICSVLRAEQGLNYVLFQRFRLTDFFIFLELLVGNSEFIIRFYAALFGVLGVVALYICCEKLWGKRLAFFSSLLLTFNYFHVYYSQDARYYAVVFFFAVLSYFFLFQLLWEKDLKFLVYKLLIYLLGVNTHPTFYMLIASEVLFLFFVLLYWVVRKPAWFINWRFFGKDIKLIFEKLKKASLLFKVIGFFLALLVVFFLYRNFYSPGAISKLSNFRWFPTDSRFLSDHFLLPPQFYWKLLRKFFGLSDLGVKRLILVFLLGVAYSLIKGRYYLISLSVFLFSVPVGLIWMLNPHSFFNYRYVIFILPLCIIFLGQGFEAIFKALEYYLLQTTIGAVKKLHWVAWAVVFFLAVFLFIIPSWQSLLYRFDGGTRYSWREQAEMLQSEYEEGDVIFANSLDALKSLPYYLMKLEGQSVANQPVIQESIRLQSISEHEINIGRYRLIFDLDYLGRIKDSIDGSLWVTWHWHRGSPPQLPFGNLFYEVNKYTFSGLAGSLTEFNKIPDIELLSSYRGAALVDEASDVHGVVYNSNYKFVQPASYDQPGFLEYEISLPAAMGQLYVHLDAYVLYEENYVKLWYSTDGEDFELLENLEGSDKVLDIKKFLEIPWSKDLSTLYLRVELFTNSKASGTESDSRIKGLGVHTPL